MLVSGSLGPDDDDFPDLAIRRGALGEKCSSLTTSEPLSDDALAFQIRLNSTVIFRFLVSVIILLLAVSLAFTTIAYVFEPARMPPWHLWPFLFNLEETQNIPGWYDTFLLLVCGLLLVGIGLGYIQAGRRWFGIGWCWLACGFLYLSLDVAAVRMDLHHSLTSQAGGAGALVWVGPAVFVIAMLPFLRALPVETLRAFVFAAIVLGFGSLALDWVANGLDAGEVRPMSSRVVSNVEEAMEMLGAAMFIRASLAYFAAHCRDIGVGTHPTG